jgi:voltage-gated potassium channel
MKEPAHNTIYQIQKILLILFSILLFGTFGYWIIEDYPPLDALYMTVITLTTVGYGETHPLSDSGRIFTMILLMISFGFYAYCLSLITLVIVEGNFSNYYRLRKTKKEIKKMKNHTIVVGYGRNGKQAVSELLIHNKAVVVIDNNNMLEENSTNKLKWILGDATNDECLMEAGIKDARSIITALPSDADNLYISISAKSINPNIMVVSRASTESAERKLKTIGVDHVIMPEKVGGIYMAGYVAQGDLTEFLNHLRIDHNNPGILAEIDCKMIHEKHLNTNIESLFSTKEEINVLGVKLPDQSFVIAPIRSLTIRDIRKIFVMGTHDDIEALKKWLQ